MTQNVKDLSYKANEKEKKVLIRRANRRQRKLQSITGYLGYLKLRKKEDVFCVPRIPDPEDSESYPSEDLCTY